jgi:hypothetical protein
MRATIYLKKKELESYLERKGYTIVTLRRVILDEFGYKNSDHFMSIYPNLSRGVLNMKLAYKDKEEYESIVLLVSDMLKYLKQEQDPSIGYGRVFGVDIKFLIRQTDETFSYTYGSKNNTLYYYTQESVFKREILTDITEKIELNGLSISI